MWRNAIDGSGELSDGCANFTRKGGFRNLGWTYAAPRWSELPKMPRMAGKGRSGEDAE